MKDGKYIPNGDLQGDTKGMPDRGTSTGLNGDTYGADISGDATNSMGGMSDTGSDDMSCDMPKMPK